MYDLPRKEYGKVRPVFADIEDNRAHVFAAIEGNSISRIEDLHKLEAPGVSRNSENGVDVFSIEMPPHQQPCEFYL